MAVPVQIQEVATLHTAAWPDMLTNLHVAYADLTRTQVELKRRAAEIEETRALFERVIESMSEALFLMDAAGRIIRVNRAASALLERDTATLLGQPFTEVYAAADVPATPWQLLTLAPSGMSPSVDTEFCTPTGRVIPVNVSCSLVRDQRGKATGVLVMARDITRRKHAEAERQELHKQLVDASRRAGMADVAAGVLHNVGNVLNNINVSVGLVTNTLNRSLVGDVDRIATMLQQHLAEIGEYFSNDPKGKQIPAYLSKLATHLAQERATMLQELDTLSNKIEHIRQIITRQQDLAKTSRVQEEVVVAELMEEALAIHLAMLQREHLDVRREYAEMPQIWTDKHQVLQILINLISNAGQAMQASHGQQHCLTLRIGLAEDRQDFVRLQVGDTGVGIKPEHLTRIFAQGFTTKKDGHGFGLHSSALAARAMGGSLSVHSQGEGQGATFTLDLPYKPVEERL